MMGIFPLQEEGYECIAAQYGLSMTRYPAHCGQAAAASSTRNGIRRAGSGMRAMVQIHPPQPSSITKAASGEAQPLVTMPSTRPRQPLEPLFDQSETL
jgi:hypothetical protein